MIGLAAIVLAAATAPALDWPWGSHSQLASPDGQHFVYGERAQAGIREGPELWLRHRGRQERKRLIRVGATARAFWSDDSRFLVVVHRESSNSMSSSLYEAEGRGVFQILPQARDPELSLLSRGHFYVEAQRFLKSGVLRVAAYGHTDNAPVQCFRFIYEATVDGKLKRISKRVSRATADACDETTE